ncbi:MAG: adenosylcobinamide-GDP ribazoletransferase [Methanophagales archaeon ANME-1-THS]|nr:MAG: adenosylcobinamide-GDP ribazoletransferase [Methanophagales archaeon ANME-1-THS]
MRDLISFLTQIPVGKDITIEAVTARSYLFPVVGLVIGLPVAVVAFLAFGCSGVAPEIAALLTVLALYLVTGLIHLDGLADFFDGLMAPGSTRDKVRAMKDDNLGTAGLFATILVLLVSLFAIEIIGAELAATASGFTFVSFYTFASVFIIAEVSAKLSMNTCMVLGMSCDRHEGLGALFIQAFSPRKYLAALLSAVFIAFLFTLSVRLLIVLTGIVVAFLVSSVARQKLGVMSGDIMGASNELARSATLLLCALL